MLALCNPAHQQFTVPPLAIIARLDDRIRYLKRFHTTHSLVYSFSLFTSPFLSVSKLWCD